MMMTSVISFAEYFDEVMLLSVDDVYLMLLSVDDLYLKLQEERNTLTKATNNLFKDIKG